MSEAKMRRIDDATLLAYREGDLDAEARGRVEEHLVIHPEDRERIVAFDHDLEFMKTAMSVAVVPFPDSAAIRRRAKRMIVRRTTIRYAAVAAVMLMVAAPFVLNQNDNPVAPAPIANAGESLDMDYLKAAVAQLEYETEVIRAMNRRSERATFGLELTYARIEDELLPHSAEEESAGILLCAAKYWTERDAELSEARYRDLAAFFPGSFAAAEAKTHGNFSNQNSTL